MNEEDKEKIKLLEKEITKIDEALLLVKPQQDLIKKIKQNKTKFQKMIENIKGKELSFLQCFEKWLIKSGGKHSQWIPDKDTYPNFRDLIERFNRYETINIKESFIWDNLFGYLQNENENYLGNVNNLGYEQLIAYLNDIEKKCNNMKESELENYNLRTLYDSIVNNNIITYIKAAQEVMSNNLKSCKIDW